MQMSNDAPNITSSEVTSVNEDTDYSYTFTVSDMDSGDTVTLAAPTKPSWLSFNAGTGVLSGMPTNSNIGDHSIVLSATDVAGAVTTQNFTITVSNINDAPTVTYAIADQTTAENSAFSYQFASDVFADVDIGDSLTNTATLSDGSALPSWLKFDADTRTFSGTPLNVNVGDIAVKVTATDSSSVTGSDTFNITVTNINDAPNITSSEVTSVNEDTDYSYTFTVSDMDSGDTVTLAAPTKPSWLSFNAGTGVLSGTPTNSNIGDHSIVLSATDVAGAVTTQNFTITVSNINDAPTVTYAIADQTTAENSAFSYQFASDVFADVDIGDSLTNTATLSDGSALPSWLKFDADTRTFSGTPLNVNVGDIAVKVTATDSSSVTGSDTFNITVTNINDAPNITSSEVTSVNEDTDYSYTFTVSDMDSGDTVTLAAPTKPSWLSFNAGTGVLSGTPTNSNIGDHSIVLSATDVAGAVTTQNFTITVSNS